MNQKEIEELSSELIRKKLGSITIDWFRRMQRLEEETLSEEEIRERAKLIRLIYDKHLKDMIDILIWGQMKEKMINVNRAPDTTFIQGTLNGLLIIKELMEDESKIALEGIGENKKDESAIDIDTSL
jgi:hypothetical protein